MFWTVCTRSEYVSLYGIRQCQRYMNKKWNNFDATLSKVEVDGKKTHCSNNQNAKLPSQKWRIETGVLVKSQKGRNVTVERRVRECTEVISVERNSTIVLSCSKIADTKWQKKTFKRRLPYRGSSPFGKKGTTAVQELPRRKLYESVVRLLASSRVSKKYLKRIGMHIRRKVRLHAQRSRRKVVERICCFIGLRVPGYRAAEIEVVFEDEHHSILERYAAPHEIAGKERVHRKELFRSVGLKSGAFVLQHSRIEHQKRLCNKNDAPAEKHGIWRKVSTSSIVLLAFWSLVITSTIFEELDERERIRGRLRAETELETVRVPRTPTTIITANGEVQTNRKQQYTFTILSSSWRCRSSRRRLPSFHWQALRRTRIFLRVGQ